MVRDAGEMAAFAKLEKAFAVATLSYPGFSELLLFSRSCREDLQVSLPGDPIQLLTSGARPEYHGSSPAGTRHS